MLVFSYKMRGQPDLYHFPFRNNGSLTKVQIFATRREKSMMSPGKSDDVSTFSDVMRFGLTLSGRSRVLL